MAPAPTPSRPLDGGSIFFTIDVCAHLLLIHYNLFSLLFVSRFRALGQQNRPWVFSMTVLL